MVIASTVPVFPCISTISPTPKWSSNNIKNPSNMSCMTFCAPKPMATEPAPAIAIKELSFTPSSTNMVQMAIKYNKYFIMLDTIE